MQHSYRAVWIFTLECKSLSVGLQRAPLKANHCKASQCTSQNLHQNTCRTTNTQRKWNIRSLFARQNVNYQLFSELAGLWGKLQHQACGSAFMTNALYRKFPDGCNQPLQISQGPATHLEVPWSFVFKEGFHQSRMTTVKTWTTKKKKKS